MSQPLLSICINTRNRAVLLSETLDSIITQIVEGVEIVVVDGASDDATPDIMHEYSSRYPYIKYVRSDKDIGIDDGYDLSVEHASGVYCWLMPDDDFIQSGALEKIISNINEDIELVIVNLACFTKDMKFDLNQRLFKYDNDRVYVIDQFEEILKEFGFGLSYIGCIVIKRSLWFEHDRTPYYGTYFIHVGVICGSSEIKKVLFLNEPLIKYRSANSSWTAMSFEIWYFKWPDLIWSFKNISIETKDIVAKRAPWQRALTLLKSRAMGEYSLPIFMKFLAKENLSIQKIRNILIALIPKAPLNLTMILLCLIFRREGLYTIYNLMTSSSVPKISQSLVNIFGVDFLENKR